MSAMIAEFLATPARNRWLETGKFEIYVRRGYHAINGKCLNTFDIASIKSLQPGSGAFRGLIADIEALLITSAKPVAGIFIESVMNPRLASTLPTMGFVLVAGSNPPSFFRPLPTL